MAGKPQLAKLSADHDLSAFDCGNELLDRFIKQYAWANQRAGSSQTYVAVADGKVVGFHSLVVGQVSYDEAPERLAKGLPRHPVPMIVLARVAVDRGWQGKGLGLALVVDAMRRVIQVGDIAGVRAMMVNAKDERAQRFYQHLGFVPFPKEPLTLYRLLKDIRVMLDA